MLLASNIGLKTYICHAYNLGVVGISHLIMSKSLSL